MSIPLDNSLDSIFMTDKILLASVSYSIPTMKVGYIGFAFLFLNFFSNFETIEGVGLHPLIFMDYFGQSNQKEYPNLLEPKSTESTDFDGNCFTIASWSFKWHYYGCDQIQPRLMTLWISGANKPMVNNGVKSTRAPKIQIRMK